MKTCILCKEPKPIEQFYRHPLAADGRMGACEECTRLRQRENGAARYLRNKLAGVCVFCGQRPARPTCVRCSRCSARKAEARRRRLAGEEPMAKLSRRKSTPGLLSGMAMRAMVEAQDRYNPLAVGSLAAAMELVAGIPVVDDNGEPTGERVPILSQAQAAKLLESVGRKK